MISYNRSIHSEATMKSCMVCGGKVADCPFCKALGIKNKAKKKKEERSREDIRQEWLEHTKKQAEKFGQITTGVSSIDRRDDFVPAATERLNKQSNVVVESVGPDERMYIVECGDGSEWIIKGPKENYYPVIAGYYKDIVEIRVITKFPFQVV